MHLDRLARAWELPLTPVQNRHPLVGSSRDPDICGDYVFGDHTASLILICVFIKACKYSWMLDKAQEWTLLSFSLMRDSFTGILKVTFR